MQKANVLLVEDSAPDAMLMKIALDEAGLDYSLTRLRDGAQAMEYVRLRRERPDTEKPDIILLDVNVPQVSGLEILKEIRTVQGLTKIPVFVFSSAQSPRDQNAIRSVSNATFTVKPSDLDGFLELGRTIKKQLEAV